MNRIPRQNHIVSALFLTLFVLHAVAIGSLPLIPIAPITSDSDFTSPGVIGQTNFQWNQTDGMGFRWDISPYGSVNDGNNDAYDGGMILQISGNQFSAPTGNASVLKGGREIFIGPWNYRNQVNVIRRVYVDPKLGYCRWIDIFQNTQARAQTIPLRYYFNLGGSIQNINTITGKTAPTDKDWAFVTSANDSNRPALVHFYGDKNCKIHPNIQMQQNNDNIYYNYNIKIPPKGVVAMCFFEFQRNGDSAARKAMKDFPLQKEMSKVPKDIRKILLNISGMSTNIADLEFFRSEESDSIERRDGEELSGELQNDQFTVETFYGKVNVPARQVIGLMVPSEGEELVKLATIDGQVLVGKLTSGPLRIKIADGKEVALPLYSIAQATYKVSKDKPTQVHLTQPAIRLRSGDQVCFDLKQLDSEFLTEYGRLKLYPKILSAIELETPGGGMHRMVFSNGSTLSGLLLIEKLSLKLHLGPDLSIRRLHAAGVYLPNPITEDESLATLLLRNGDKLLGSLASPTLNIKTQSGQTAINSKEISQLSRIANALDHVSVRLKNGSVVTGDLVDRTLKFQIPDGPEVPVFIGHVVSFNQPIPKPKEEPKPTPQTQPTTKPTPSTKPGIPASKNAAVERVEIAPDAAERAKKAAEKARLLKELEMRKKVMSQ